MDKKKVALMMGGSNNSIPKPDAAFDFVPFKIYKSGTGVFSITPSFNLQTYAGITVSKTYYVATDGNDLNNGLTPETALAKVNTAINKADADRVYVKAGWYTHSNGWNSASPNRSIEVIGYGGDVTITRDVVGLSWSAVDNHWEASYVSNISCIFDTSITDIHGDYQNLLRVPDVVTVDSTVGSFYYDAVADIIYIRTSDSREPDADIHCQYGDIVGYINYPVTYYIENLNFYGGSRPFLISSASALTKLYAKDCEFSYGGDQNEGINASGGGEVILMDCLSVKCAGDGFKVQTNTIDCNFIAYNCKSRSHGKTGNTVINGFSRHGGGANVLINCEFYENFGPGHADINTTKTWCLGENSHDAISASNRVGYSIANTVQMWLDTCQSSDNADGDMVASAGSTIKYRNFTPTSPITSGDGTIITY